MLRRLIAAAAWTGAALLAAVAVVAVMLVFPSAPKPTTSLHFVGFIRLPRQTRAGALSILDYLTVEGRSLFVASESAGGVYRVPLSEGPLPFDPGIGWLAGPPAAHGVAFDPASKLGFVSRSESNTVDVFDPAKMTTIKPRVTAPRAWRSIRRIGGCSSSARTTR
jgi:DNA-binding beta-propeller fold protein YncE